MLTKCCFLITIENHRFLKTRNAQETKVVAKHCYLSGRLRAGNWTFFKRGFKKGEDRRQTVRNAQVVNLKQNKTKIAVDEWKRAKSKCHEARQLQQ